MEEDDWTNDTIDLMDIEKTITIKKTITICKNNTRYCHKLCTHLNHTNCELFEEKTRKISVYNNKKYEANGRVSKCIRMFGLGNKGGK